MKKKESEEEFREIENREMKTRENMQSMLFKIENNRNKKEDTMNCDMFLKLDDERSKVWFLKKNNSNFYFFCGLILFLYDQY